MEKKPQVKLLTLYENTSKSGQTYLSGTMGGVRVVGFRSKFEDKGPRWNIYVEERDKKEGRSEQKSDPSFDSIDKIPF